MINEFSLFSLKNNIIIKMDILMVKTIVVLGIIAGCFIVLYPKIFHPMVNNVLGASHATDNEDDMC